METINNIGLKPQDIVVGKKVYYYSFVSECENSAPQEAVIRTGVHEIGGTLVCWIDTMAACVALSNLSFEPYPEKKLTAQQRTAKERYYKYVHGDGIYDGISFGDYLKYKMYKD